MDISFPEPDKFSRVENDIPRITVEDEVDAVKRLLHRMGTLTNLETFDAVVAMLQDPRARFLRTREGWADVGGWPVADATPVAVAGPEGVELYYSEREVAPIGEPKTLSEFKAGKDGGVRGTMQLLETATHGALRLNTEILVDDEPRGDVEIPEAAVRVVAPYISEVRDELDATGERPAVFQLAVSSELNRRQFLARIIRGFAIVVLRFAHPWRVLDERDRGVVDKLVDEAFGARKQYTEAVATAWSVLRDGADRQLREGEVVDFEVDLTVWIVKKRLGVRPGKFDRGIEAFVSDRARTAPQGVSFIRVLRAATIVERAVLNSHPYDGLAFPAGSGEHILALVAAEGH